MTKDEWIVKAREVLAQLDKNQDVCTYCDLALGEHEDECVLRVLLEEPIEDLPPNLAPGLQLAMEICQDNFYLLTAQKKIELELARARAVKP